jgi:hypothetical protein
MVKVDVKSQMRQTFRDGGSTLQEFQHRSSSPKWFIHFTIQN